MQHIGIDIGKAAIHVAIAHDGDPKRYPVHTIEYSNPDWWLHLLALVTPPAIVAAEPTGWHYFKPIVTALEQHEQANLIEVLQVNHQITAAVRQASFGRAKNDRIDAQAIAHIAAHRDNYTGWKPYNHQLHTDSYALRLLVNEHRRLTRNSTRRLNQLDALAHSIWPQLAINRDTWLNCVTLQAIDPLEILALIATGRPAATHPNAWRAIRENFSKLPPIHGNELVKANVRRAAADYQRLQTELAGIETELTARVTNEPFTAITQRWLTVPYITELGCAALHVATEGQADQITISQSKAALGVHPTTASSGNTDKSKQAKSGYRPAKDVIFHTVRSLIKIGTNPIAAYFNAGHNANACRRKLAGILSGIARDPDGRWQ